MEAKLEARMKELDDAQDEKIYKSHAAVAKTVSELGKEIRDLNDSINGVDWESLKAWSRLMEGAVTFRAFITGLASIVIAFGAIGAGVIWMIKTLR